jgi:chromosome partitioning protein
VYGSRSAKVFAWSATALITTVLAGAVYFWNYAIEFVKSNELAFKLVGLGIGPFLAVVSFAWGLVDKAELKRLAHKLGIAEQRAEDRKKDAEAARAEFDAKEARIASLQKDLNTIAHVGRLWKLRENAPFPEYRAWKYDPDGAKVVTVGLFKGGVGKSHIAANFAAYVSEKHEKPVLLIDLDYQGSLSALLLTAAGVEPVGSYVDALFEETADIATLNAKSIQLARHGSDTVLNRKQGLARAWLVPADYTLAEVESQLLVDRVFHDTSRLDERYRLAHLLLHPNVRRHFGLIILDTPPRMTLGTVNALVASHSYIVPTVLDRVSSEAVRPFLTQIEALRKDLDVDVRAAGIIGSMTRELDMSDKEKQYFQQIEDTAQEILGGGREYMIKQNLPRKTQVTNENDLGYFLRDDKGWLADRFYNSIFDELWTRIVTPPESH